ncbi:DUF6527 family protein [Nocardia sp. NPDC051990]|uniref:DUF6527 family protein n=1 Tax=Nocardia sp. NPDC051990 TaxID=3155285 RepID=UPI003416620A
MTRIVPVFVTSFPAELEPGHLYVSAQFSTAAHLCACGCGREVITPLSPAQWVLMFDGTVTIRPSIGNWALPCQPTTSSTTARSNGRATSPATRSS